MIIYPNASAFGVLNKLKVKLRSYCCNSTGLILQKIILREENEFIRMQ